MLQSLIILLSFFKNINVLLKNFFTILLKIPIEKIIIVIIEKQKDRVNLHFALDYHDLLVL